MLTGSMSIYHGFISFRGGAPFIPKKVAQGCMKSKTNDFPGLKLPGSLHCWARRADSLVTYADHRLTSALAFR